MITLVAILTVHRSEADAFYAYEKQAERIMKKYGGSIVEAIPGKAVQDKHFNEIHVVTFPDHGSFAAYGKDAELLALRHLRERSVVNTEICDDH